jgi:hypothetical protein
MAHIPGIEPKVVEVIDDMSTVEVLSPRRKWIPVLGTIGAVNNKAQVRVLEGNNGMTLHWTSVSMGVCERFYLSWQWRRKPIYPTDK